MGYASATSVRPWRDPGLSDPALPAAPPASQALQSVMTQALQDLTQSHVPQSGVPQICVPAASFTASAPWSTVGQPVTFTSTATDAYGELETPAWTFVDGGPPVSATGQSVTQSFARPGVAVVRLVATDTSGASATRFQTRLVCPCPPSGTAGVVWPLEAQTGTDCRLTPIGSLARRGASLSFRPNCRALLRGRPAARSTDGHEPGQGARHHPSRERPHAGRLHRHRGIQALGPAAAADAGGARARTTPRLPACAAQSQPLTISAKAGSPRSDARSSSVRASSASEGESSIARRRCSSAASVRPARASKQAVLKYSAP